MTAARATCPPRKGRTPSTRRPHNAFGKRLKAVRAELKKAGKPSGIPARVDAVANEDSDGDGVSNLLELVTGHFPGEADDRPSPGRTGQRPHGHRRAETEHRADMPWNPFERVARPELSRCPIPGLGRETRSMSSSPPNTSHAG